MHINMTVAHGSSQLRVQNQANNCSHILYMHTRSFLNKPLNRNKENVNIIQLDM